MHEKLSSRFCIHFVRLSIACDSGLLLNAHDSNGNNINSIKLLHKVEYVCSRLNSHFGDVLAVGSRRPLCQDLPVDTTGRHGQCKTSTNPRFGPMYHVGRKKL